MKNLVEAKDKKICPLNEREYFTVNLRTENICAGLTGRFRF
jgi:hypothetical protein